MNSSHPPLLPFAIPEAGFEYFATQTHFRSVASRIITTLGGFNVVVVTGDRLPGGPMVAALAEAAAGRYTVVGFGCEPEPGQNSLPSHTPLSAHLPSSNVAGNSEVRALVVFCDTDRYSDKQIEVTFKHLHQRVRSGDHLITSVVFLARPEFLTRLEHPMHRVWLAKHLFVARLRFYELGTDEILAFIHHQLPSREAQKIFTDEAIAAIADVSGGDPVVVNRFSRRMLDCAVTSTGNMIARDLGSATMLSPDTSHNEPGVTTFAERLWQHYATPRPDPYLSTRIRSDRSARFKFGAGIAFCFACVAAVAFIYSAAEDFVSSRIAPATEVRAKLPDHAASTGWAPAELDTASTKATIAAPGKAALNAGTELAEPTPEDTLVFKTPPLPPSVAPLRSAPELTTPKESAKTVLNATVSLSEPTEVAPPPTVVSTTESQTSKSTPSTHYPLPAPPAPEATSAMKTPALPASIAALRPTGEPAAANEATETVVNAAAPFAKAIEATATAVSPTETLAPRLPSTSDPMPTRLHLPASEIAALLARGDTLLARGDVSSARLFYERAADAGDGHAALKLGHTYDPVLLDFAHLRVRGDAAIAQSWYSRARELGETEAEFKLTPAYRYHQDAVTAPKRKIAPAKRGAALEQQPGSASMSQHLPSSRSNTGAQPE